MEGFPTQQSQHLGARVLQILVVLPSVNIGTPAQNQRKETALSRRVMAFVSQSNPQDRKKTCQVAMENHLWDEKPSVSAEKKKLAC